MNRRDVIKGGAISVGVLALTGCPGQKSLSAWVTTIVAAFGEMKPLLAELGLSQAIITKVSGWIDTAVKIAKDFDEAYRAGKFKDAVTLFNNLGGLITQIAGALGAVDNRIVKLALISIAIARIAISSLLANHASASPEAMAVVNAASASDTAEIKRLAEVNVNGLYRDLYK